MSSSHHGQAFRQAAPLPSRPRPTTKARHEQSASPVPIPVNPNLRDSRYPHGKKHSPPMSAPEVNDAARRPRTQRQHDDFHSMGTWCNSIPEKHYSPRITIDDSQRTKHLPRAPTPPTRLNAPHPSFLSFDAEFTEPQPDKDDLVGDAWVLSRQAKTNRQCEQLPSRLMPALLLRAAVPLCTRLAMPLTHRVAQRRNFLPPMPRLLIP